MDTLVKKIIKNAETHPIVWLLSVAVIIAIIILLIRRHTDFYNVDERSDNMKNPMTYTILGNDNKYGSKNDGMKQTDYDVLGEIPASEMDASVVLPNMMHLPKVGFMGFPHEYDPVSGLDVTMYSSPRVPLTDFKSETTRDYQKYDKNYIKFSDLPPENK